jgi:hypothetical protein
VDGWQDYILWKSEKEVGNVGSACSNMKMEMEIMKTLELRQPIGMVNVVRLVKLNKG